MAFYAGGRLHYKAYKLNSEGVRIAEICTRNECPDLQSACFFNYDKTIALRYVPLDLDAKYTSAEFLDENGVIVWEKIAAVLKEMFPELLRYVEFSVRSYSGKGIHMVIGISPLLLNDKSIPAQKLARKIQMDIIGVF